MRNTRAEHLLQWLYAYVMVILGALAIGASGQAGSTPQVDALRMKLPGQRDPLALQATQACRAREDAGAGRNSCSEEADWQDLKQESSDLAEFDEAD
jgi:hypothetical protein